MLIIIDFKIKTFHNLADFLVLLLERPPAGERKVYQRSCLYEISCCKLELLNWIGMLGIKLEHQVGAWSSTLSFNRPSKLDNHTIYLSAVI